MVVLPRWTTRGSAEATRALFCIAVKQD